MKRLILIAALCLAPSLAFAQAPPTVRLCNGTQPNCPLVSNSNPLPTSTTATVTGFAPGGTYATLTATASSADAALPAGAVVTAWNTGTTSVSCVIGVGAQTSTASKNIIPSGGSWFAFTVGSNTHLACINQAGDGASNVVVLSGGSGLPTGSGGGGGAGSSTITNWGSGSNTLGAMANYGTSPGAVLVPGVNAYVTNAIPLGSTTSASSSPVVIASDQAAVATKAASGAIASGAVVDITNMSASTGAAPPAKAIYLGANAAGAPGGQVRGLINCDSHVFKHITSATDTLAVQGVASQTIYVCGWRSRAAGVATWFLENTASANANCSSANTQITGVATEAANTGEVNNNPIWGGLKNTSGNGLCINSTGTGGVDVDLWYTQF